MPPIKMHGEKAEMLRKQVIAKVHWGARREEIFEWLQEEKGVTGAEAEALFTEAVKARAKEVRTRAVLSLIASGIFIVITAGYFVIQIRGGFVVVGKPVLVFLGVALASVFVFIRSLVRLLTGKNEGPID